MARVLRLSPANLRIPSESIRKRKGCDVWFTEIGGPRRCASHFVLLKILIKIGSKPRLHLMLIDILYANLANVWRVVTGITICVCGCVY